MSIFTEMRTENEMYELILNMAKEDERIKAVYMNGSRTNPNVPRDIFQDYDIVYVVEKTENFIKNSEWLPEEEWKAFLETYFNAEIDDIWKAVFKMCDLFKMEAKYVSEQLGYSYNEAEGDAALWYLKQVYIFGGY